ncbi:phenylacetate-CoA oxygenase subunit PaaJ [Lewinellaceae bacterium SD302]|nr:phenylacetate-CoA oxygenase subunit PaaJ [Lewinellaceae bacterium SD302]
MTSAEVNIDERLAPLLREVSDPEIPVLSIMDMGVVREARLEGKTAYIKLTPTYSGCPAMDVMGVDIQRLLKKYGYDAKVELVLSPAWTTDWITPSGRASLEAYGIAVPLEPEADKAALTGSERIVKCTHCGSQNTRVVSAFGSTACKALFQCDDCLEPFDYFKCLK